MSLADEARRACERFGADPATLRLDAVEVEGDTAFVSASVMMDRDVWFVLRPDVVEVTVVVE